MEEEDEAGGLTKKAGKKRRCDVAVVLLFSSVFLLSLSGPLWSRLHTPPKPEPDRDTIRPRSRTVPPAEQVFFLQRVNECSLLSLPL